MDIILKLSDNSLDTQNFVLTQSLEYFGRNLLGFWFYFPSIPNTLGYARKQCAS